MIILTNIMQGKINKITEYIFINSKPERADLTIVFDTRHKEPLLKVSELYKKGFMSKMLLNERINEETKKNVLKGDFFGIIVKWHQELRL